MKRKMIKVAIILLSIAAILSVVYFNSSDRSQKDAGVFLETLTYNDLVSYTQKYQDLVDDVGNSLQDEGYEFVLDYAVLPNENIELIINLPNEKIKKTTKKEIQQIALDVIEQNNVNPTLVQFNITSFDKSAKAENTLFP